LFAIAKTPGFGMDGRVIFRGFRYRLYPSPEQEARLRDWAGAGRYVYNLALEQRRDWWRQYRANTGRNISLASQSREVTLLRESAAWLSEPPRSLLEYALRDLDRAFVGFFRGGGFPAFRSKDQHVGFCMQAREAKWHALNRKWGVVNLSKGLACRFRLTRAIIGKANSVTIQNVAGAWFVSFAAEVERPITVGGPAVGIDRGIANTLALSTGDLLSMPDALKQSAARRGRAQRVLSRRQRTSRRRAGQRALVSRLYAHEAASRRHWLHEQSTDIANRFGAVAIEALRTANMTKAGRGKYGLNRSILAQGWASFATMLSYKLAERGGALYLVNPAYTSQTCSACGSIAKESRKSQASFECIDCGHTAHADINAAINILRRSPAGVEGAGYGPVEAQPGEMVKHLENLAA
jgi:putative transposase